MLQSYIINFLKKFSELFVIHIFDVREKKIAQTIERENEAFRYVFNKRRIFESEMMDRMEHTLRVLSEAETRFLGGDAPEAYRGMGKKLYASMDIVSFVVRNAPYLDEGAYKVYCTKPLRGTSRY